MPHVAKQARNDFAILSLQVIASRDMKSIVAGPLSVTVGIGTHSELSESKQSTLS